MVETILSHLVFNPSYFQKVWPYMAPDYFEPGPARNLFKIIDKHVAEYNSQPSMTAIEVALNKSSLGEVEFENTKSLAHELKELPENLDWLVAETEKYVKDRAMYNALSRAVEIQSNAELPPEKRDKRIPEPGVITEIMQKALAISFDTSVGHDWAEDYADRFRSYFEKTAKVPFSIPILNKITKGGAERGTLNILMAGVNVGKSLGLCSLAADYLKEGFNVLYISMEMAERVCAKRIDANILDISLDELDDGVVGFKEYEARMKRACSGKIGKLIVKQYPTAGANANTFRALLNELKLKKGFVPDIIMVDYLGICASTRVRGGENTYILVKSIAEELRGLAVETNTVMWSGAQTGKGSWESSDLNMSDVAESAGLPATADFMLGVVELDELAQQGLQQFIQIKSRYGDKNYIKHFKLGVKKGNQRWYETDDTKALAAQQPNVQEAYGAMNIQDHEDRALLNNKRTTVDNLVEQLQF